mgnify:CR=1 FL=1
MHDTRVLRLSGLFYLGEKELVLTSPKKVVSATEIPPLIIKKKGVSTVEMACQLYPNRRHLTPMNVNLTKSLVLQGLLLKEHLARARDAGGYY